MQQVYIVHGYGASPDKHWFPWLEQALTALGIRCERLMMPNSDNPTPDQWLEHLNQHIRIDEQTVVVGHSLGCIALLNFLAKQYAQPAGAVFVSGFYQPLDNLPELTPFSNLYAISPTLLPFKRYVIASIDDQIVPHRYSDQLAQHLNADYIRLNAGEHFLDRQGVTELPLVLSLIKKIFGLS